MRRSKAALKRLAVEVVGWALLLLGIAAIPLPGPGLLILFLGLLVLSTQYAWAERRVRPVQRAALKGAADSVQTWPRILLSLLGVAWLCGLGVVFILGPEAPSWWPLEEKYWLFGGSTTGITLVASGVIALGMLGYSFVKFRGADDPHAAAADVVESEH